MKQIKYDMGQPNLYAHRRLAPSEITQNHLGIWDPGLIVPYAGRKVFVEVNKQEKKTKHIVVGFIYARGDAPHPLYFYGMPRSDEDAPPLTQVNSITDGKQKLELEDMLKHEGA